MKTLMLLIINCFFTLTTFAQKEIFDLTSYTPPKDASGINWKKDVTENVIIYTSVNKINNNWCRINIVKSTISKGSIDQDFESEWQDLVVKSYRPTETAKLNEVQENKGWKIKTGAVNFTFNKAGALALLTTMSGFGRCVSIVATTNSQDYLNDIQMLLSSVDVQKPETGSQQTSVAANDENSIIGTWGISMVVPYRNGTEGSAGSNIKQYTFNANGSYSFYIKTFKYNYANLILTRETGTYQISGTNITISPQKSVIQEWSKKDGTDNWGKILSTQNKTLEKTIYQFSKHYSAGIQVWNLVLQANKETQRDGPFNGGNAYTNAWLYSPVTCKKCFIELPD